MTRCLAAVAILLMVLVSGCDDGGTKPKADDPHFSLTSPENLVENLQIAYRRREPDRYAVLLHSDFTFQFQAVDAQQIGREFWTRDEDSTQTHALFSAIEVTRIDINLTYEPATPVSAGSDTMFIRVNPTFLEVDEQSGIGITTTWRVSGDIQDMLFVRGEGANSTRWYLLDWRDINGGSQFARTAAPQSREVTWGKIKAQY